LSVNVVQQALSIGCATLRQVEEKTGCSRTYLLFVTPPALAISSC